jgi:RNA polymerase sigma factor (sigma-70 family)
MLGTGPQTEDGKSGRDARLSQLVTAYRAPLVRYFGRRGVPPDALEDCAQEVFLRLSRADNGTIENAEAYLFTIASAVIVDRARRRKARWAEFHVPLENISLTEGGPGPERVLEGREELLRIQTILAKLPQRTREIFLLNRLEGLTYTQLATRYGITVKGIEKQMSKALAHIRAGLGDNG